VFLFAASDQAGAESGEPARFDEEQEDEHAPVRELGGDEVEVDPLHPAPEDVHDRQVAEDEEHHPDIDIRYNKVRLVLTTHSKGGLTELDFGLAERIDTLSE